MSTFLANLAEKRASLHANRDPSMAPIIDGYDEIGLHGEVAFGEFCGLCPNFIDRSNGDNGIDFTIPLKFTVDVKTSQHAGSLLVDSRKPVAADIYVLAHMVDGKATLVGWEWGRNVANAEIVDFGHGIPSRRIARERLRPMEWLADRLWRCG